MFYSVFIHCAVAEAIYGAFESTSWDGTLSYENVMCGGMESSLTQCSLSPVSDQTCFDRSRLAGVNCTEGGISLMHIIYVGFEL